MAWISVDQKLIGGKLRTLYKSIGCSRNEAIGILITLWLWGVDNAETDGLIPSADRRDIAEVLKSGMSENLDSEFVVGCLIENGWIDVNAGCFYLHDWSEWRAYYNRYVRDRQNNSDRQARYKARHREEYNGESNVISNVSDNGDGSPENGSPKKVSENKPDKYGKDFEEFWAVYPRKVDKGQCFKKYKARINDGYSKDELLEAAHNYAEQCRKQRTDQQFIKHGKTFLGDTLSFTDYIPPKQKKDPVIQQESEIPDGTNPFRKGESDG